MVQGHLDSLADCVTAEVLKEDCENYEVRNSGVRSLRELQKVYR